MDFLTANDALVARREAHRLELDTRRAIRASIPPGITRQVADAFTADEAHSARAAHLQSLGHLAMAHAPPISGASDRVNAALTRARAQGNFSAIEALERELDRDRDEEEQAVMLLLTS